MQECFQNAVAAFDGRTDTGRSVLGPNPVSVAAPLEVSVVAAETMTGQCRAKVALMLSLFTYTMVMPPWAMSITHCCTLQLQAHCLA